MATREDLMRVFEDTEQWYRENAELKASIQASIQGTEFYAEGDTPSVPDVRYEKTTISVNKYRSLETAMFYRRKFTNARIGIHNFASATNPGGGVRKGSRAQEEALCRCTTLLPVLETGENRKRFYQFHRNRRDSVYTAACLYTPDILAIKTDSEIPSRLKRDNWQVFDVLTMAAPNLRLRPNNSMNPGQSRAANLTERELFDVHALRARHLLSIASHHGVEILVLGAFGCGAFENDPEVVARAYRDILPEFDGKFREISFAVYCTPRDRKNFDVFPKMLG